MATDGTRQRDNDLIATDDISDGGVADGQKAQRVKMGYGANNFYNDVSQDSPMPVGSLMASAVNFGLVFFAGIRATVASSSVLELLITTPASGDISSMFSVDSTLDVEIDFFEGTTTSADGAAVTAFNYNRTSATTANVVVTQGPTITADGTILKPTLLRRGSKNVVGQMSSQVSMILLNSTKYLVRATSQANGNIININSDWLEN